MESKDFALKVKGITSEAKQITLEVKPFGSGAKGFALKANGFAFGAKDFTFEAKDFALEVKPFALEVKEWKSDQLSGNRTLNPAKFAGLRSDEQCRVTNVAAFNDSPSATGKRYQPILSVAFAEDPPGDLGRFIYYKSQQLRIPTERPKRSADFHVLGSESLADCVLLR